MMNQDYSKQLHPIYSALDAHDFKRAVKLALALPKSNFLGQALLAHALAKSGQPSKCFGVLQSLFGSGWNELDKLESEPLISTETQLNAETNSTAHVKGKRAKGKSKNVVANTVIIQQHLQQKQQLDIVENLSTTNTKQTWTDIDPPILHPTMFSDNTTVETLSLTLQTLRLLETNYYLWKLSSLSPMKQFKAGIHILLATTTTILSTLQLVALQCARVHSSDYTNWATLVGLWQLHYGDLTDAQRAMLTRLTTSLASKKVESAQEFLLLNETLSNDTSTTIVEWLDKVPSQPPTQGVIPLSTIQRCELKASHYEKTNKWNQVINIHQDLLKLAPDQWSYWKKLVQAAYHDGGMESVASVVDETLNRLDRDGTTAHRSHLLIHCEVAAMTILNEDDGVQILCSAMQTYVSQWATQASCTFSDVEPYVELYCTKASDSQRTSMYNWALQKYHLHRTVDDRSKLRAYICSIQVLYKLVQCTQETSWLPDWRPMVTTWQGFSSAKSIQKENQPADELVLLAVQGLLFQSCNESQLMLAATLLELGKAKSPYNPYIKIQLLQVYAKLQAYDEAWSLFRDLGIKHIQIDSCTYLILDHLLDGGMYQQACLLAGEIMKFHVSALRDAGDFIGMAMQEGNYSKADDFLKFQLSRMTPSLALLEARGVVLDCAPMMEGGQLGMTGQESDVSIAKAIASEVHSIFGAPSLLIESKTIFSDNRDHTILDFQILHKYPSTTESSIVTTAMRRKTIHSLLVRAVLVIDATKAPKKGKIVASSESLTLRSQSLEDLLECTDSSDEWINIMKAFCSAILVVCCGLPEDGNDDSLLIREERVTTLLQALKLPTIPDPWTPPAICRFLSDNLVAVNALLESLAKQFALFGWGKLKQRNSVAALARVATDLGRLVSSIKTAFVSSVTTSAEMAHCNEIVDNAVYGVVLSKVRDSRSSSRTQNVVNRLEEMEQSLASFASE